MIDKARAAGAGRLGDHYRYPCPIDRTCLDELGIDAGKFADIAQNAATDHDALKALRGAGIRSADDARFDPVQRNRELHADGS
jgi:hypothetical protein